MSNLILLPWHLMVTIVAGAVNQEQQRVIDYLQAENQVLREKLGKKSILLIDDQRRRIAVKAKVLDRKVFGQVSCIAIPDSILRWHRKLVAAKWDYTARRKTSVRPRIPEEATKLILKFAHEKPSWGYERIQGALANIGPTISDTSVRSIVKANGVEPAPVRKRSASWKTFLSAHWDVLAAIDCTIIEVWIKG